MSLYAWVLIASIIGPLGLSFDKKVHFYTTWKLLIPSILAIAVPFIVWDIYFTHLGVWGFNPNYLSGVYLMNIPIEEVLFFVLVPFCCLFIYEVLLAYFPNVNLTLFTRVFVFFFGLMALILAIKFMDRWYTLTACSAALLLLLNFFVRLRSAWFPRFCFSFLVCLIPFFIVNGILTGMFTDEPVVWYNEEQFSGIRIGTIPLEDVFYNIAMLLPITALYEWLKKNKR
jgi:lycopene cyclase domain-containing protein